MKEIQTLPQSLQGQLEKAQALLSAGQQYADAGNRSKAVFFTQQGIEAVIEIAQRNPVMATFLMGAMQGERYFEMKTIEETLTHREETVSYSPLKREFFPIKDVKTTTTIYRFGKEEADEPTD